MKEFSTRNKAKKITTLSQQFTAVPTLSLRANTKLFCNFVSKGPHRCIHFDFTVRMYCSVRCVQCTMYSLYTGQGHSKVMLYIDFAD